MAVVKRNELETLTSLGWLIFAAFMMGVIAAEKHYWWIWAPALIVLVESRRLYRDAHPTLSPAEKESNGRETKGDV